MKSNFILAVLLAGLSQMVSCNAMVIVHPLKPDHPANRLATQAPLPEDSGILQSEPVEAVTPVPAHHHKHH
jgi:hypothetical protein